MTTELRGVRWFAALRLKDVPLVGGKNASLGELYAELSAGVQVPNGFALTADAYRDALDRGRTPGRGCMRCSTASMSPTWRCSRSARSRRGEIVYAATGTEALRTARRDAYRTLEESTATESPSRCAARRRPRTCRPQASPASTRAS